jgi:acetyltransferase-like isoleucine patch superfamily enzyme
METPIGAGVGVGGIFVAVGRAVDVGLGVTVFVGKGVLVASRVLVGTGVAVANNDPPTHAENDTAIAKANTTCMYVRFCFMGSSFS